MSLKLAIFAHNPELIFPASLSLCLDHEIPIDKAFGMCWSFRTLAQVGRQLSSELVGSEETQLNPLCLHSRHHLPTFLPGNIPDSSWLPSVERSIHLKSNQPEKPVFQLNLTIFHQDTERLVLERFKQPRNPREPEVSTTSYSFSIPETPRIGLHASSLLWSGRNRGGNMCGGQAKEVRSAQQEWKPEIRRDLSQPLLFVSLSE